jgi:hypothetical protein
MRPIAITIKYDSGQLDIANGANAATIWEYWQTCEVFAANHGMRHAGPKFKRIDCITQAADVPADALVISNAGCKP